MNAKNYIETLKNVYVGGTNNHPEHNSNPNYWGLLLKRIISDPQSFEGKNFLDFGCGKGRNVGNARALANWGSCDGVDISPNNISFCRANNDSSLGNFFNNNGEDLADLKSNFYDFIMSTIVLQHICSYDVRYKILCELYRVMRSGGILSIQMGFGDMSFKGDAEVSNYHDNNFTATNSNGTFDVRVENPDDIISDLKSVGFKDVTYEIRDSWADGGHRQWIYLEASK
jgi:ubiquinone/menaquinone biosynthesis C-methylase UbiE